MSNEQCSAPWENSESRAVLKINKLLELSTARLYREITARHSPSVSLSVLFYLFLRCGQLWLSQKGPFKIRKSDTVNTNSAAHNLYVPAISAAYSNSAWWMSRLIRRLTELTRRLQDVWGNKSRGEEKEDFVNLPSKLSNYVNQKFSKCQQCLKG